MKKIMTAGIALMTVAMSAMAHDNRFCISKHGKTSPVIVDRQDWKGVIRAANDLGDDVRKVTGVASEVIHEPEHRVPAYHRHGCKLLPIKTLFFNI